MNKKELKQMEEIYDNKLASMGDMMTDKELAMWCMDKYSNLQLKEVIGILAEKAIEISNKISKTSDGYVLNKLEGENNMLQEIIKLIPKPQNHE